MSGGYSERWSKRVSCRVRQDQAKAGLMERQSGAPELQRRSVGLRLGVLHVAGAPIR